MPFRLVRVLIAASIAEVVPIGLIGGACICVLPAWWLAPSLPGRQLVHGFAIGLIGGGLGVELGSRA